MIPPGWAQDGFLRVDGFAEAAVGEAMLDDVITVVHTADQGGDVSPSVVTPEQQTDFADRASGPAEPEDLVSKVFGLHRRPVFRSFLERPEVTVILRELLGPDVDCFLSQFIFKNAGAWGQPWHQDSFYFPFTPARPIVGLWLAVTPATLANGCLHVLPGSHTQSIHDHVADRRPAANHGYVEIVDHDMAASQPVTMSPGDLLVFDSHLMHRSTDNESEQIRAAMVFHCCRAGTVDQGFDLLDGWKNPLNDFVPLLRSA